MSRPDNVTPFRPRRPPPKPPSQGLGINTHRGRAVLVQALALTSFAATFFFRTPRELATIASLVGLGLGLAGLFIASQHRNGGMPWAVTHHEHALRTIVIGAAVWTLGSLLSLFGPLAAYQIFVYLAVMLWVAVRTIVGLVLAILRRPIWRPKGILF